MRRHAASFWGVVPIAFALSIHAFFASWGQSLWFLIPAVCMVVRWPPWVSPRLTMIGLFLSGIGLGLSPAFGVGHAVLLTAVVSRSLHRWLILSATALAVGPFILVMLVLSHTRWEVEASRACTLGSALAMGVALAGWGAQREFVLRRPRWLACGLGFFCLIGFLTPRLTAQWPVSPRLTTQGEGHQSLVSLLRRRAAGDFDAGYAAVGLWLSAFRADLHTVRRTCPTMGLFPSEARTLNTHQLGVSVCEVVRQPIEKAIENLERYELPQPATHFHIDALRHELRAESGVVEHGAPLWLKQTTGRADAGASDWHEFNQLLDFTDPIPVRVRRIRGHGTGELSVTYARDLESFALTTRTVNGGLGYRVQLPAPQVSTKRLTVRGVSRRGLLIQLIDSQGRSWRWGCGLSGARQFSLSPKICGGQPSLETWVLPETIELRELLLFGEFALQRLVGEG